MAGTNGNGKLNKDGLTVPQRILKLLSDGMPHRIEELHACLHEQDAPFSNVSPHLFALRKALRARGEDIVCRTLSSGFDRWYQHVRLLHDPSRD